MAYKKVESRLDKRKFNVKKSKQLLSYLIPIAGVLILSATAIFYVYPKITNGASNDIKSASTKIVKKDKNDESKEEANDKTTTEQGSEQTTTNQTDTPKEQSNETEYILPESNLKKLTNEEVEKIPTNELRLARNEIYARHGFVFKSSDLSSYFSTKSWYRINPLYDGALDEIEKYNLSLIKSKEDSIN